MEERSVNWQFLFGLTHLKKDLHRGSGLNATLLITFEHRMTLLNETWYWLKWVVCKAKVQCKFKSSIFHFLHLSFSAIDKLLSELKTWTGICAVCMKLCMYIIKWPLCYYSPRELKTLVFFNVHISMRLEFLERMVIAMYLFDICFSQRTCISVHKVLVIRQHGEDSSAAREFNEILLSRENIFLRKAFFILLSWTEKLRLWVFFSERKQASCFKQAMLGGEKMLRWFSLNLGLVWSRAF